MRAWTKIAAGFACAASSCLPALAQAGDGPYAGIEAGLNFQSRQDWLQDGADLGNFSFKNGFVTGLDGGYAFANGFRPELEFDYRRNDLDQFVSGSFGQAAAGGFENNYSLLANLWYDYKAPSGFFSVVQPYLGVGLGGARVAIRHPSIGGLGGDSAYDTLFAYQGGAGVGFVLTPRLTLTADWRYLETQRGAFQVGAGDPIDARYRSNGVLLGLRYRFGTPPAQLQPVAETTPPPVPQAPTSPPPPAKPACHPPAGFKVDEHCRIVEQKVILRSINFQLDSDRLTAPARQTLDEVARALSAQPELSVEIDGYTDSTGPAAYNRRLSQRRAEAVKNYLVSKGVKAEALSAKGYGASHPLASNKTAEGRALNRRVEFVVLRAPAHVKVIEQGSTKASQAAAQEPAPPKK